MRLVLASASPRRAELLRAAGFSFDIHPVDLDERVLPAEAADTYVRRLALAKASEVVRRISGSTVIGADTTVVVDHRILGKPEDDREAASMLEMLSGRSHDVLTGVAVAAGSARLAVVECTRVHFLQLSPAEIAWYVGSGEPRDKAGAYAVQGLASRFIDRLEGSYSNVVGLPIAAVYQLLRRVNAI